MPMGGACRRKSLLSCSERLGQSIDLRLRFAPAGYAFRFAPAGYAFRFAPASDEVGLPFGRFRATEPRLRQSRTGGRRGRQNGLAVARDPSGRFVDDVADVTEHLTDGEP